MSKKIFFVMCMLLPFILFAQKKGKDQYVFKFDSGIVIDGAINDWTNHLYNKDSQLWTFGVVVNDTDLFATAIVKDQQLVAEAVRNGILLNISYSDKKKDGARLLFPRFNLEKLESIIDEDQEDVKFSNLELLESAKGYYVAGFSKLPNGLISFDNQYGVKVKCTIDSSGHLIYEAKVPLRLINFNTNKIAVELGINTQYTQMKKAMASRSSDNVPSYMFGRGYLSNSSVKNPYGEDTVVWFSGNIK